MSTKPKKTVLAVATKLAHMQHEDWIARRKKVTPERIARAMAILNKPTGIDPDPKDRLPEGYASLPR